MSRAATDWAWSIKGVSSSEKLTLLALADRADEVHECFPSIARLADDTGLNRKTIMACIQRLIKAGLMADTGRRRGLSGQVKVYLLGVEHLFVSEPEAPARVPKTGQYQKRDSTKNGTVPNLPIKSPKNGTGNSTKNGTRNQSLEPVSNQEQEHALANHGITPLTDHVPMDLDWEPDMERLATLSRLAGLPTEFFTPELIGHFKIYYEASNRVQDSAKWHRDLISWARREQSMQAGRAAKAPARQATASSYDCPKCGNHANDCACWADDLRLN